MRKIVTGLLGAALISSNAMATTHVSGQGTIEAGRTFVVNAIINDDGTVSGQATLINRNFSGSSGKGPYTLHVDITCAYRLDSNTVIIGGATSRTNDSSLVDAVYFSVRDNGTSGDQISRAYFFDGDPMTMGDPALCLGSTLNDLPLEDVQRGNIKVH